MNFKNHGGVMKYFLVFVQSILFNVYKKINLKSINSRIAAIILFAYCTNTATAQQNLFNIPSGDITNTKKIFYQHQLNVYSDKLESKAHFVYGLGKGWDAGINLVGKGFYFAPEWRLLHNDNVSKGSVYPILMGTVQKQFQVSDHFDINVGTQIGFNISNKLQNKELELKVRKKIGVDENA